jgi:hypothetical protein
LKIRRLTGSLLNLAIIGACAYGLVKWQSSAPEAGEVTSFAASACVDAARSRYDLSDARHYKTSQNSSGFVVRVSATTSRGKPAKIICLVNTHGGVNEISIDER